MKEKLLAVGGVASALAASSCCIVPLALVSVGVSGAWMGHLTALAPYQPIFILLAVGCLGAGFWMVYRPAGKTGAAGVCAVPGCGRFVMRALWVKSLLWLGTALVAGSVGVDYGLRLII